MPLSDYDDNALSAELNRREQLRKETEEKLLVEKSVIIHKHVDALLELVPNHSRTSCSDDDPGNAGRCARCTLLQTQSNGCHDWAYDIVIAFTKRVDLL